MNKGDFSIFTDQPDLVYLDSAATALKPQVVIDALEDYYRNYSANTHRGIYGLSEKATERYEEARAKVARLINAQPQEVIFTSGTTSGLNTVANSYRGILKPDDEIMLPLSEHHANFLPWQRLARRTGATLKVVDDLSNTITDKTKILAIAHASNVLGTVSDIKAIAAQAKQINPSAHVVVDGAQAVPHLPVDVTELGVDYYAFSGHKIYGPTGIGALWVNPERLDTLQPLTVGGGAVGKVTIDDFTLLQAPQGFEAGTPPIAEAIGMGVAADYLASNRTTVNLSEPLFNAISSLPFIDVLGDNKSNRVPLTSFNIKGLHAHDVAQFLADKNICVRAGHHCTMPLHSSLGITASVRASLGVYNGQQDIDKLTEALKECYKTLGGESE